MSVRRYRVTAGKHTAGSVVYRQGDVLESTRQLDVIFRNKFVEVSDITPITAPPDAKGLPPPTFHSPAVEEGAKQEAVIRELRLKLQTKEQELSKREVIIECQKTQIKTLTAERNALLEDGNKPPVPAPRAGKKKAASLKDDPFATED